MRRVYQHVIIEAVKLQLKVDYATFAKLYHIAN